MAPFWHSFQPMCAKGLQYRASVPLLRAPSHFVRQNQLRRSLSSVAASVPSRSLLLARPTGWQVIPHRPGAY
jgi:hypothetical protein